MHETEMKLYILEICSNYTVQGLFSNFRVKKSLLNRPKSGFIQRQIKNLQTWCNRFILPIRVDEPQIAAIKSADSGSYLIFSGLIDPFFRITYNQIADSI